jgi:hypothetical protein
MTALAHANMLFRSSVPDYHDSSVSVLNSFLPHFLNPSEPKEDSLGKRVEVGSSSNHQVNMKNES